LIELPVRHYCRYPYEEPRGLVESVEHLDPHRTAFLLVDVYGLGHDPGDSVPDLPPLFLPELHRQQGAIVRDRIRPALDSAHAVGLPVIYTENSWENASWARSEFARLVDRSETGMLGGFEDLHVGTGHNAYSDVIAPREDDIVVKKTMYDGFYETSLDAVLRNLDAKHLVVVGFTAEMCLLHTVVGAMYRNYRVIVLRDCVLGAEFVDTLADRAITRWAIRYYEAMVGFTSTSHEFISACAGACTPMTR
jgi:nicotinamidase-related amidase